ncbi:MAG: hypothetical protein H0T92_04410 [Pyrinomonadaceae bacterium]|nr:hypothetical protein [Pyrinomonadaceae bacterium]
MQTIIQPERIEELAVAITNDTRAIAALREQLAIIEAHHTLDIQSAKDEHGKPQYTNEDARRAAHTLRLADDEHHRRLTLKLRDTEQERARRDASLERLRREFKLYVLDRQEAITRTSDDLPSGFPYK